MILDCKNTRDLLLAIATMFQEKRDELARLDSMVGDGDHGVSMARGAQVAYREVSVLDENQPLQEYFKVYGRALVAEIGGAIGPLFGMIFTEFGKCVKNLDQVTALAAAQAIENSKNKVMEFGGAKQNDKTMVDAMIPAAEASMSAAQVPGATLEDVLKAAKNAAYEGVQATIPLMSRRGRSKFLQEKSIGHQDAGATSYYYLLNRMYEYCCGNTAYIPVSANTVHTWDGEYEEESKAAVISKFINNPDDLVKETISGYVKAYPDYLKKLPNTNVVARKHQTLGKVGVIIGNGSGHEPSCLGFVGENFLDANACGGIFAAPGPYTILEAIREANTGAGVCVLISAHAGDILNAKMAMDMAEDDGIKVKGILLYDDVASAAKGQPLSERRGSIGTLFNYKMVGSYAEGHTLDEVVAMAEKIRDNSRSIAAAMVPGTSPVTGIPMFEAKPGVTLVGLGVHGESAMQIYENKDCREIARGMISELVEDKPYVAGDEVAVIVNSAGQTTQMELMIFYDSVESYLREKGIRIFHPLIGRYITTQEMGGIGLAVCKMDEEMKKAWLKPTNAPNFSLI